MLFGQRTAAQRQGMTRENRKKARVTRKKCWITLMAVAVIAGGLYAGSTLLERSTTETQARGVAQSQIGQRRQVTYDGQTYAERTGQTRLLLMGVDREDGTERINARQGGQADFMLLMVIDHEQREIKTLQLERDTMTAVQVLGVLGNPVGTKEMQLCLSHGYGLTEEASCENTVTAVENLLEGAHISYYMAMDMSAISTLNDMLGGVTVTLEDDFSDIDTAMTQGATLTLHGEQAETFVRSRMSVGDGTNNARMSRQRVYMEAAAEQLRQRLSENANFLGELLDSLGDHVTMNIKRGKLLNEANRAYKYERGPVETLDGSYSLGADGYVEFHPAEGAAVQWVLQTLYEPVTDK